MEKYLAITLSLIVGINLHAQSSLDELAFELQLDSFVVAESLCETAKNMAQKDIENGRYAAFFHGYRANNSNTFERLMLRKYGVYALRTGWCSGDDFLSCYSEVSIPVIKEKFGEDIFEKTKIEALELDRSGKGDREAFYHEGWFEFIKIFYCEMDDELLGKYKSRKNYPTASVTLHVDIEGNLHSPEVVFCDDQKVISEIKRIARKLPKFEPATEDGIPVEDKLTFGVKFHKKWKRKTCR